jgi:hypothetical protein
MADVLNTATLELRASVNEAQEPYTSPPWIIITRAQFDLWSTIPQQYREWTGAAIEEMTGPEKTAADLAALKASRDAIVQQLDQQEDILRWFAGMVVDEFNAHSDKTNTILSAIDNAASLAALKTAVAAIQDLPTRTMQQVRSAIRNKAGS